MDDADGGTTDRVRLAGGVAVIAAAVLLVCGFAATPASIGEGTAGALRGELAAPERTQASSVLLHYGYLLLIPTALVLAHLARRRPALSAVGAALAVLGAATLAGFVTLDLFELTLAREVGPGRGAAISEDAFSVWGGAVMAIPGPLGTLAGFALLALAAWRSRALPAWWSITLLAGLVLTVAAGRNRVLEIAGPGVLGLALVVLGARVLSMPDGVWRARGSDAPAEACED